MALAVVRLDGNRAPASRPRSGSVLAPEVLFTPAPSGEAMLLAVLTARQLEEVGRPATVRGMPLGLPALSPEQIQLVASWIEQGRPR